MLFVLWFGLVGWLVGLSFFVRVQIVERMEAEHQKEKKARHTKNRWLESCREDDLRARAGSRVEHWVRPYKRSGVVPTANQAE